MATTISQQVEQMILKAKGDSERRVRHELQAARTELQRMEATINQLTERVERSVRSRAGSLAHQSEERQIVDQAFLNQQICILEQKFAHETKALKQDLHRTILAHNHNSDLMRHHRDALDEACRRLDTHPMRPEAESVNMQVAHLDHVLRQSQAKQQAIDMVPDQLAILEAQVSAMLSDSAANSVYRKALSAQAQAEADGKFNAEAPVFVPRSQPQDADASAGGAAASESAGSTEPAATPTEPAAEEAQ